MYSIRLKSENIKASKMSELTPNNRSSLPGNIRIKLCFQVSNV